MVSRIDRINGLVGSIAVKSPVKVATTEAITLSGAQTIDTIVLTADASPRQRVLVKDQADDTENGIYDVNSGTWDRSPDFDGSRDAVDGTQVLVNEGAAGFVKSYALSGTNPVDIGTDSLSFVAAFKFSVSDDAYDESSWDGETLVSPSKNSVRDKIETMLSDTAYNETSWDGVTGTAPSKNAVRDKFVTIDASINVMATVVPTVAALKVLTAQASIPAVIVLGYTSEGDGGGGPIRIWDYNGTPGYYTDNGGNIILPTGGDGSGAWLFSEPCGDVASWGAVGSGDHSAQIQNANDYTKATELIFNNTQDVQTIGTGSTVTLDVPISAGPFQILTVTGTLQLENSARTISSLWFAPDPWDSFKIAAEDILVPYLGGTIKMDNAIYRADTPVLINSRHTVNIIGNMIYKRIGSATTLLDENYITPATGIGSSEALIEYDGLGGGLVSGLFFMDDNAIEESADADKRSVEVDACLLFTDWDLCRAENLSFTFILGSAIHLKGAVQSEIDSIWVRNSGTTSKPAIYFENTGGGFSAQSFILSNVRSEVNYDAPYIYLGTETTKCKLINVGCEAVQSDTDSNQMYIHNEGDYNQFDVMHMNRNLELKIKDDGIGNQWKNVHASSGGDNGVIESTGEGFQLTGYSSNNHTAATDEIYCTGQGAQLSNVTSLDGGGVRVTGNDSMISNINMIRTNGCTNGIINIDTSSEISNAIVRDQVVSAHQIYFSGGSCIVSNANLSDPITGYAGIYASTSANAIIYGNKIRTISGSTGIDTSNAINNSVFGNIIAGAGTSYSGGTGDVSTGSNIV